MRQTLSCQQVRHRRLEPPAVRLESANQSRPPTNHGRLSVPIRLAAASKNAKQATDTATDAASALTDASRDEAVTEDAAAVTSSDSETTAATKAGTLKVGERC